LDECVARPPKLHEVVVADVLAAILRGEYEEGAKLPNEKPLAESFDVSRYVAREGIQALRDRGIVHVKHGVGAVVSPRSRWNLLDPLLLDAMAGGPDADAAVGEARECAAVVWPQVAGLAARRRTAEDIERLDAAQTAEDVREALIVAARNRFLGQVATSMDRVAGDGGKLAAYANVVAAVREGDAGAATEAMAALAVAPSSRRRTRRRAG
jgi:DNA-binding FadR family transcriptional regulator